jgi:phospholipid/cholesterol/gamma-HCH transport system substrate-binding protein
VQGLITDVPDLLAEAILLMRDIRSFTTPENGATITEILNNVEQATARIDSMANRTEAVMASAEQTLALADTALAEAQTAFASSNTVIGAELPALVDRLKAAIDNIGRTSTQIEAFTSDALPQFRALAQDSRALIANIGAIASRIGSDPGRFFLGNQTPAYRN